MALGSAPHLAGIDVTALWLSHDEATHNDLWHRMRLVELGGNTDDGPVVDPDGIPLDVRNRQLNKAIHTAALAQISRPDTEGRAYYLGVPSPT